MTCTTSNDPTVTPRQLASATVDECGNKNGLSYATQEFCFLKLNDTVVGT